jgi:hypothetical protein
VVSKVWCQSANTNSWRSLSAHCRLDRDIINVASLHFVARTGPYQLVALFTCESRVLVRLPADSKVVLLPTCVSNRRLSVAISTGSRKIQIVNIGNAPSAMHNHIDRNSRLSHSVEAHTKRWSLALSMASI